MTGETVGTAQHLDGLPTAKRSLGWLKWSLVPLGVLAFVLALIGYRRALPDAATTDAPFYVLNLLALNYSSPPDAPPAELDIARFLVHVVAAGAAVVAAFTLLQNRRDRWTVGRMRGHVVVAGNSQLVPDLAINYRRVSKSARHPKVCVLARLDTDTTNRLRALAIKVVGGNCCRTPRRSTTSTQLAYSHHIWRQLV